jgi:hypothetical protein
VEKTQQQQQQQQQRPPAMEEGRQETVNLAPPLPCEVSHETFHSCLPDLRQYLCTKHEGFVAGQIKLHYDNWSQITSDPEILQTVNKETCLSNLQKKESKNCLMLVLISFNDQRPL